ncbi:MAG: hypothetical protein B6241_05110 [Spirochaetaceae bacterium 4572_59]|nr:MAG: hypothetical protein B6241_05110 [Spirochaetaceae bacterium 4572_59]
MKRSEPLIQTGGSVCGQHPTGLVCSGLTDYSRRRKSTFKPVCLHTIIDDCLGILENSIDKKIPIILFSAVVKSMSQAETFIMMSLLPFFLP